MVNYKTCKEKQEDEDKLGFEILAESLNEFFYNFFMAFFSF